MVPDRLPHTGASSTSMSTCTRQTPQQQLAERRERLKRKANEDLQASMPRAFGCDTLPSSQDRKGKSREVSPSLPAFPGQGSVSDEEDVRLSTPELDLDMLLDGLEIDESIKQMAKDDPIFRADLKRQLATMQIPERWNGQADQGFDEEDIDEEADLGECDLDQTLYYGPPRPPIPFRFKDGALRMTRTPGRAERETPNCISMEELIDKDSLVACCAFAFFIGQNEFFRYLPMQPEAKVPLYIGRDINLDPYAPQVMQALGETQGTNSKSKISGKHLEKIQPHMNQVYRQLHGENFHPFFPRCPGCAHSKILLLVYPTYLRLVITSCNFMNIDFREGDNHWYIHDLPRYKANKALSPNTSFEKLLTVHLRELNVPSSFFDLYFSGRFDFSRVKVHLVTSRPGLLPSVLSESSGLLRLRKIVSELEERSEMIRNGVQLEWCSGSIGHLNDKWLKEFYDCAIGRKMLTLAKLDCPIPPIEVVFPTYTDVEKCDDLARTVAAKNIGCHMNWGNAREDIQKLFSHFKSKDLGKLFHMKLMIAINPNDYHGLPYYIYVGSANFSNGAWGKLAKAPKGDRTAPVGSLRVEGCVNYECGIIIPRSVLMALLEPGSDWQDIVPYERPAKRYNLDASDGSNRPYLKNPNEGSSD